MLKCHFSNWNHKNLVHRRCYMLKNLTSYYNELSFMRAHCSNCYHFLLIFNSHSLLFSLTELSSSHSHSLSFVSSLDSPSRSLSSFTLSLSLVDSISLLPFCGFQSSFKWVLVVWLVPGSQCSGLLVRFGCLGSGSWWFRWLHRGSRCGGSVV